jgi:glycosyltransferase involved in cell wall biosynthesis
MGNSTTKTPLASVSVIIPCYQCGNTIERAIASVYAQTLRPAEVVLVDDCSEDDTPIILQRIKNRYPEDWIKVTSTPHNSGPGAARNLGWKLAKQPYIAFLDADDSWHPQKIEIQYRWMSCHPDATLTGHLCVYTSESNRNILAGTRYLVTNVSTYSVTKRKMLIANRFSTPTIMLRRDIQHRFLESKRYSEDYLLWLNIICTGHKAYKIDLPLAFLHKAPYGEGGLSSHIFKMQFGEIETFRLLLRSRCITYPAFILLGTWSWLKFLRRLTITLSQKIRISYSI